MKGHMQDGKFHPHTQYKAVRKARDQSTKTQGVELCPSCNKNPKGSISRLCEPCLKKNTAQYIRKREQEIYDMRVVNITRDLEKEGKSQKEIKKILQERLGSRRKKRFISEDDLDRKSPIQIEALFKEVEKNWTKNELASNEGDGQALVYTNKEDPDYTYEFHPMDDDETEDENGKELEDPIEHNAWYFFPAKNGKGIPNSPTVISETGGYTRKDAIREFHKEFISYDQEFSS